MYVVPIDESSNQTDPCLFTEELAAQKGLAVYQNLLLSNHEDQNLPIISADTVVCCNGRILGKPRNEDDAMQMLKSLIGHEHMVVSGVAVTVSGITRTASAVTKVLVDNVSDEELLRYIKSGEPMDKAGAYAIQGLFSKWISSIDGCYFNVVGLPVNMLNKLYFECVGEYLA